MNLHPRYRDSHSSWARSSISSMEVCTFQVAGRKADAEELAAVMLNQSHRQLLTHTAGNTCCQKLLRDNFLFFFPLKHSRPIWFSSLISLLIIPNVDPE